MKTIEEIRERRRNYYRKHDKTVNGAIARKKATTKWRLKK